MVNCFFWFSQPRKMIWCLEIPWLDDCDMCSVHCYMVREGHALLYSIKFIF
jgi:hypothetical protein